MPPGKLKKGLQWVIAPITAFARTRRKPNQTWQCSPVHPCAEPKRR
jgi:hypothetical protein